MAPGTVWTQEQCDARLVSDLMRYAAEVDRALGAAPTSQAQFDALVSFHYNTGAIARATLTRKHRAGDHEAAAGEFGKWMRAGGKCAARPGPAARGRSGALYASVGSVMPLRLRNGGTDPGRRACRPCPLPSAALAQRGAWQRRGGDQRSCSSAVNSLPAVGPQPFERAVAHLVLHPRRTLDPIAEIDIGQAGSRGARGYGRG